MTVKGFEGCETCGGTGKGERLLYIDGVPQFNTDNSEIYEPCPSCSGVGVVPDPETVEVVARTIAAVELPNDHHASTEWLTWIDTARAALFAYARQVKETK